MKILSIIGARPQFIKAAPVSRAIRRKHKEILLHTGQHYDENMSMIFFDDLGIPRPDYNLGIGSDSHAVQTARMLEGIETVLFEQNPDVVLVYGDTNSTIAGALAATKLHIPVAHVEAGLRSFNWDMPEEINRVLTDRISGWLFCPTRTAVDHLKNEGITEGVYLTGDVMYDALLYFSEIAEKRESPLRKFGLREKSYCLATVHRPANTDNPENLKAILQAFIESGETILFPVHPRTYKFITDYGLDRIIEKTPSVRLIEPLSYLDILMLEKHAGKILTDSGGIQKEAYLWGVPCITLREETEWTETVDEGWNRLVGARYSEILEAILDFQPNAAQKFSYGDGHASEAIVKILEETLAKD
ncbi:MAG TPA: UDP-N-acetylglucosamine 2-epimerase (non-hydrolyzing) [Bacteroidetes bacterium]|nr:UDP-N-acetylglucosamine 2-epimerase (non-hydrolyzing) [Bacteroidota bacterium]